MSTFDTHLGDFYAPIPNFERVFGIPLCDCKFADIGNSKVGYHHTKQENDICTRCGHYVFYGSEKDVTDVSDSNIIRYSDGKIEAVREAYMVSGNVSAVAREFGVSRHTVNTYCKDILKNNRYSESFIEEVRVAHLKCINSIETAKLFNIPKATIDTWVGQFGWKRKIKTYNITTIEKAKQLYENGVRHKKICEDLDIVPKTLASWVCKWRKK